MLFAYFDGASLCALSGIIIHECTHMLGARSILGNKIISMTANLCILLPISGSFKKYDHHNFLGVKHKDPDLPLDIEIKLVQGNSIMKMIYLITYPYFYVVRGLFIRKRVTTHEIVNVLVQFLYVAMVYRMLRMKAIYYMALSLWMGYSIHPAAAHLIAEHFTFSDGQETNSYYGGLNRIFMNIGYHIEHHDFTAIPWDNLPKVSRIAPEYYDCFDKQFSWLYVFYRFVTQRIHGPQSRVARDMEVHNEGREMEILKVRLLGENCA